MLSYDKYSANNFGNHPVGAEMLSVKLLSLAFLIKATTEMETNEKVPKDTKLKGSFFFFFLLS